MTEQTVKLGDIIGLEIPVNGKWTCLAKTRKQERCQHPVAMSKCKDACNILQHKMTFQMTERDLIQTHIKKLVELLFLKGCKHSDIEDQMSEQLTKWLDLWLAELEEPSVRQRHQSYDSAIALDEPEQSEPEAIVPDHRPHVITHIPATILYPTLPLETSPVSTNAPFLSTAEPIYLNRTISLNSTENVSGQMTEIAKTSQSHVLEHDAPLRPNQTSSHENMGLGVIFSPNQLGVINIILQIGLQFCAFFQIQQGSIISRDGPGNKRSESFLRFKLIFGAEFIPSKILTTPWVMIPLVISLSQIMYILIGPWLSFMLFVFVALVGSCSSETMEKAVVRRTERAY
ncbi:uncharacterized protein N7484_001213 [Penicillium longicatenatum]|uniref:uncharacterized protein n=1 Tax=Penicillium longicatenatum TaxID=1561947 RepID=UPI002548C192|nr:uncharacterized protein N7484_001213 [Penicillium longicatenatum]KAJ5657564.1 hypothetical protein N7484_001213 [Penicillium longicatenatum]